MTDLRKAAEMALDTLDAISESGIYYKENPFDAYMRLRSMARGAIQALRQALAQSKQDEGMTKLDVCCRVLTWNRAQEKPPIEITKEYWVVSQILDMLPKAQPDPEHFCDTHCVHTDHHPDCELAQPKQEPVAWMQIGVSDEYKGVVLPTMKKPKEYDHNWWRFEPLYAAPISEPVKGDISEPVENLEPVAWLWLSKGKPVNALMRKPNMGDGYYAEKGFSFEPLFTAPPKREWQELTDEDWHNLPTSNKQGCERDAEIFNWIEDKLKEKNT